MEDGEVSRARRGRAMYACHMGGQLRGFAHAPACEGGWRRGLRAEDIGHEVLQGRRQGVVRTPAHYMEDVDGEVSRRACGQRFNEVEVEQFILVILPQAT